MIVAGDCDSSLRSVGRLTSKCERYGREGEEKEKTEKREKEMKIRTSLICSQLTHSCAGTISHPPTITHTHTHTHTHTRRLLKIMQGESMRGVIAADCLKLMVNILADEMGMAQKMFLQLGGDASGKAVQQMLLELTKIHGVDWQVMSNEHRQNYSLTGENGQNNLLVTTGFAPPPLPLLPLPLSLLSSSRLSSSRQVSIILALRVVTQIVGMAPAITTTFKALTTARGLLLQDHEDKGRGDRGERNDSGGEDDGLERWQMQQIEAWIEGLKFGKIHSLQNAQKTFLCLVPSLLNTALSDVIEPMKSTTSSSSSSDKPSREGLTSSSSSSSSSPPPSSSSSSDTNGPSRHHDDHNNNDDDGGGGGGGNYSSTIATESMLRVCSLLRLAILHVIVVRVRAVHLLAWGAVEPVDDRLPYRPRPAKGGRDERCGEKLETVP